MLTTVIIGRCRMCRGVIVREPVAICSICQLGHWGGRRYYLSRLEAAVAQLIALGAGRCLHTRELIDWLWADDPNGGPDDADQAVRSAIWRLKRWAYADWIENEFGHGWRINMTAPPPAPLRVYRVRTLHGGPMTESGVRTDGAFA